MNKIFANPFSASLLWGIIGGALLILTSNLFNKGLFEILPYPFVLILALVTLKPEGEKNF